MQTLTQATPPKQTTLVQYKKIDNDLDAFKFGSSEAAGVDVYAIEDTWIFPMRVIKIPVNCAIALPSYRFALVTSRSGMSSKGVVVIPGIVDSDYRGQIQAIVTRVGWLPKKIRKGERIAQMIILEHDKNYFEEVDYLGTTERGTKGFGSSGNK